MLFQVTFIVLTAALTLLSPPHLVYGKHRELCDLNDSDCLTEGAKRASAKYWKGETTNVPSLERLVEELIVVQMPTLNYTGRNITLSGLNTCVPELLKIHKTDVLVSDYRISCKHLIVSGQCESHGTLGPYSLEGKGHVDVNLNDYVLKFTGEVEVVVVEDEKHYLNVKTYEFSSEPRGSVQYKFDDLFFGDRDNTAAIEKLFNDNRQQTENVQKSAMKQLFGTYMSVIALHLKLYPLEDNFYKEF